VPYPISTADEQLIAAIVPTIARALPAPAPLATLPAPAHRTPSDRSALIDVTRVDRSGRVTATVLIAALGWAPGMCLDLDIREGAIVIRAQSTGRHRVGSRGDISLPAAVRTLVGITSGAPVFMAALVTRNLLVIHSAGAITRLLRRTYDRLIGDLDDL